MKEQILKLRREGKTYNEIVDIIGCSKSTVSYHCGRGQKDKSYNRCKGYRKSKKGIIRKKIYNFMSPKEDSNIEVDRSRLVNKIINNPICYLTGENIDLEDSSSFELDHIIPRCKGGLNVENNLGLTSKNANQAKGAMTVEEFINLCKLVLLNIGYKIE